MKLGPRPFAANGKAIRLAKNRLEENAERFLVSGEPAKIAPCDVSSGRREDTLVNLEQVETRRCPCYIRQGMNSHGSWRIREGFYVTGFSDRAGTAAVCMRDLNSFECYSHRSLLMACAEFPDSPCV